MNRLIGAAALFLFLPTSMADTVLGVYAGGGVWIQEYNGDIGRSRISVDNDLSLDDSTRGYFYLAIEHPIPIVPNVKFQYTNIDTDGDGRVNAGDVFDDVNFPNAEDVASDVDLSFADLTLYYELLDNWLNLDLGVTARYFDGDARIRGLTSGIEESVDFQFVLPLAYGKAQFDLPLTGLSIGAEVNGIAYSGNHLVDVAAKISYQTDILPLIDIGVEVGYRVLDLETDDAGELNSNIDASGPFVGLIAHF